MSSQLQQEERKFEEAKQRLKRAKIEVAKENVGRLLKGSNDKELGEACRQLAGYLRPPTHRQRKTESNPSPV